jgi:hypothetical protein
MHAATITKRVAQRDGALQAFTDRLFPLVSPGAALGPHRRMVPYPS